PSCDDVRRSTRKSRDVRRTAAGSRRLEPNVDVGRHQVGARGFDDGTGWARASRDGVRQPSTARRAVRRLRREEPSRQGAVGEWDGAKWERIPVNGIAPSPRSHHRMAYDAARGVILLFGGGRRTNETWTWDGRTWKQHAVDGPPGRDTHAMAYDAARQRVV